MTIELVLPDDLAREAESAGLLSGDHLERWIRAELRRIKTAGLFAAMERMDDLDDTPPLSPEEIAQEIRARRRERQASNAA